MKETFQICKYYLLLVNFLFNKQFYNIFRILSLVATISINFVVYFHLINWKLGLRSFDEASEIPQFPVCTA
jgi:hypothetical protein